MFRTVNTVQSLSLELHSWKSFFGALPKDPYVPQGFRYKAIAWLQFDANYTTFKSLGKRPLQQSADYNPVHGGLVRHYPIVDDELLARQDTKNLVLTAAKEWNLNPTDVMLFQLQRVDCLPNRQGVPAVEGFHQDGNDFAGLLCISRENLNERSGETTLSEDAEGKNAVFKGILQPGDLVLFSDRHLWHYTDPIELSKTEEKFGFRDVVLLSGPSQHFMGALQE
jgi:hypothetical protein